MSQNYFEEELRRDLKYALSSGQLLEHKDASHFFSELMKTYPTSGSKIDWKNAPNSSEQTEGNPHLQITHFIDFFDEMCRKFNLSGNAIYAGDSATDFALEGSIGSIKEALPKLLSIPQHHYIIGPGCVWCACLTMEGDMGFCAKLTPT